VGVDGPGLCADPDAAAGRTRAIRPYWVALVLIYWNLEAGSMRHLGQAFVLGLVLDITTGTLLGSMRSA
jgi:rod shape-determining protein MreD